VDRTQLFDTLSNLPPAAFERLLIVVNMPRMNRTGAAATIGEQVSVLLGWAESPIGPGIDVIARHLTELNHFEFDAYLRSLVATYEKWWQYYTLTDAVGKVEQPAPEKPSVFDFGPMVQTVAKETDVPGSDPRAEEREKTERLPVLEGIRKYADDHVLLVGCPGSGKSTALIRLLLEEATQTLQQSEGKVPVLVELRYWNTSIEGLIQGFLQRHGLTLDDATLSTLLSQGRFLLLIDGLNELPSESARTHLSAFRRNYPKVPMIFTTRDLGLGGDLGIEKKLEMQPLTEAQMKDFIRAYVPDQAEAMLRQLNDRLREFGQTPLLLWMLCEVFQQSPHRQMPTNLAEVFRAFTTMYEDSSVRKHEVALLKGDVRPLSDRRLWKDALKALAALMMQGETPVDFRVAIHRTEAERELSKLFANEKFPIRDIVDDLLKYHLLQNSTTDQLEFRHQLIQEYYVAEYLLRLLPELSDEQLTQGYLNLLKWTEPIALMLALVNEEAQVLRVVKLTMDGVDLMLGVRLAGKVKASLQPKTIGWIDARKIPSDLQVNCWVTSRSEAAIPGLLWLVHQDSKARWKAAGALEKLGSAATITNLWQLHLRQPERHLKNAISAIQERCKFYNYEIWQGTMPQGQAVSLYCSYASADEALQTQLANHLTLLERQGVITSWSSHQILPGSDRTQTIHQQLNTADIILLLISPDAIADDTCYHLEIQRAIERHQSGEARVIPIRLRPVDWQGAPFSQLDVLPKNHQPVTTWPNPDQAFQEIAEGIHTVAMEVRKEKRGE